MQTSFILSLTFRTDSPVGQTVLKFSNFHQIWPSLARLRASAAPDAPHGPASGNQGLC